MRLFVVFVRSHTRMQSDYRGSNSTKVELHAKPTPWFLSLMEATVLTANLNLSGCNWREGKGSRVSHIHDIHFVQTWFWKKKWHYWSLLYLQFVPLSQKHKSQNANDLLVTAAVPCKRVKLATMIFNKQDKLLKVEFHQAASSHLISSSRYHLPVSVHI